MAGNKKARDLLKRLRRAKNQITYYGRRYDDMGRADDLARWQAAVKLKNQLEAELYGD